MANPIRDWGLAIFLEPAFPLFGGFAPDGAVGLPTCTESLHSFEIANRINQWPFTLPYAAKIVCATAAASDPRPCSKYTTKAISGFSVGA